MKRIYFLYVFLGISITLIFLLYIKRPIIDASIKNLNEAIVFYDDDNEIKGAYLEVDDPIKDIFSYLTDKRNSLPLEALSHADSNVILNEYYKEEETLCLNISSKNIISKTEFFPLLFESYYALGYECLKIISDNEVYWYDSIGIFRISKYDSYRVISLDGSIRKNYMFDDNEIILDVLYTDKLDVEKILNEIEGISFEVIDSFINIEIIDTLNKDLLIHLIELNLNGLSYSFQVS